jgi:hypothetical protein
MSRTDRAEWLAGLRPAVQHWIGEQCRQLIQFFGGTKSSGGKDLIRASERFTLTYADLTLAFGLAWLGRPADECRRLIEEARQRFHPRDEAHTFLFRAYEYRIGQTLEGTPGRGSLPAELLEDLRQLQERRSRPEWWLRAGSTQLLYTIDRLRSYSEILEPHGGVDPYREWIRGKWERRQEVWQLCDIADPVELADQIRGLMQDVAGRPASDQVEVLRMALSLSPRVEPGLAESLFTQVPSLVGRLTQPLERAELLQTALSAAAHFHQAKFGREFVAVLLGLLDSPDCVLLARMRDRTVRLLVRALRQLGLWQELGQLVSWLAELILQGEGTAKLRRRLQEQESRDRKPEDRMAPLRSLLHVAGGWLDLGQTEQALEVLDEVWDLMVGHVRGSQMFLSWAYTRTLGRLPADTGLRRGEEVFRELRGVYDTFSSCTHYTLAPLHLVESLVLTMTAESIEFLPPPSAASSP